MKFIGGYVGSPFAGIAPWVLMGAHVRLAAPLVMVTGIVGSAAMRRFFPTPVEATEPQ